MHWLITVVGGTLALAGLRDMFHTLWHPARHGALSTLVMRSAWWLSRHCDRRGRLATLTGPIALVAVVVMWTTLIVVGWMIMYWPHMPHAFVFSDSLEVTTRHDLLDSLYLSLATVATLGSGDIVPDDGWLRIAAPTEAVVGFALLTGAVSWVLQIFPALTRRRLLALRLTSLRTATGPAGPLVTTTAAGLLTELATEVRQVRMDFSHLPESYYFREGDDRLSLAMALGYAADLAEQGRRSPRAEVREAAALFGEALADLSDVLQRRLGVRGTPTEVFTAYAADHGRVLVRG